jgi:hypothetical protein
MSLTLEGPASADTRSRNADFLELSAFLSTRGRASGGTLLGVQDLASDSAAEEKQFDPETHEELDEAILEGARDQIVDAAFEELAYRQNCLKDSYPFELDLAAQTLRYCKEDGLTGIGATTYLFCLLVSAMRESRFMPNDLLNAVVSRIGSAFQICACIATGGYIPGEVASFGFPRATGDAFHSALQATYHRFGAGKVHETADIPEGLPTALKDGGIDVIAWRDLPDQMPGKIYLLGQCASGANWKEKSVVEYIPQLHGAWFTLSPAQHYIPAMFIPFPFHHDLDEPLVVTFPQTIRNRYWYEEKRFGIIFDRLRVAHLAESCMALPGDTLGRVDGSGKFEEVRTWIKDAVAIINPEVVPT